MKRFYLSVLLICFSVISSGNFLESRQSCFAENSYIEKWFSIGEILPCEKINWKRLNDDFDYTHDGKGEYKIYAIIPYQEGAILKIRDSEEIKKHNYTLNNNYYGNKVTVEEETDFFKLSEPEYELYIYKGYDFKETKFICSMIESCLVEDIGINKIKLRYKIKDAPDGWEDVTDKK